ncbi:MAG: DUF1156 domain-containing protein, partial [Candidatus Asgardarchaeia archaeon]
QDRKLEEFKGSWELIDVLHHVLLLWKTGRKEDMDRVLEETGYGRRESFYRVAQAISSALPIESRERKLLDGFLSGRNKLLTKLKKRYIQGRLFE